MRVKQSAYGWAIAVLIALLQAGCTKPGCLGNAGERDSIELQLGEFRSLRVESAIDVILEQRDPGRIQITGPSRVIGNISTSIREGKLTLRNEGDCNWLRDPDERVSVRLGVSELSRLEYEGSGRITNLDTLRFDNFVIHSEEGAGSIDLHMVNVYTGLFVNLENASTTLHGRSLQCNTYSNSRALTDLSDFQVNRMVIEYGGLTDTYIYVLDELDATNFYKGNIYFRGNPQVKRNLRYGSGDIIRIP